MKITLAFFMFFIYEKSIAQKIFLKAGIDKTFLYNPKNTISVNRFSNPLQPWPIFFIEYHKPIKNNYKHLYFGLGYNYNNVSATLNTKNPNIDFSGSSIVSRTGILLVGVYRLYVGYEKIIQPKRFNENKSYFSFNYGVSLNYFNRDSSYTRLNNGNYGYMKNGDEIVGGFNYGVRPKTLFSVSAFAGLKYHFVNKKGNEVLGVELSCNIMPFSTMRQNANYTLAGVQKSEYLGVRGLNVQVTLVKKLWQKRYKKK